MTTAPADAPAAPAAAPLLARIHAWLGVWLGVVLVFHTWEGFAALHGRDAHAARVAATSLRGIGLAASIALVLAPFAAHAVIGVMLAARARPLEAGNYTSPGMRRLHIITGSVTLAFLVYHVGHAWVPGLGPGAVMLPYETLWVDLGKPLILGVYLVGLTATMFHVSQGLASAASTLGLVRTLRGAGAARIAGAVIAFALWFLLLNVLTHFARGEALFFAPTDDPAATDAPPSTDAAPPAGAE